jgi:hypothetical protein
MRRNPKPVVSKVEPSAIQNPKSEGPAESFGAGGQENSVRDKE